MKPNVVAILAPRPVEQRDQAMIEKIKKMPPDAQILPRFPGQILQVIARQWRLGAVQPQKADFHLIRGMLVLRRQRRNHIAAGKPQPCGSRKPDPFLAGLFVAVSLQIIPVMPVNQVHQLEKTVSPRIAQNGLQLGYISGC